MKKSEDDLFLIIQSLSRTEKGYVKKIFARHSVEKNFSFLIFEQMEKQENYDEHEIKTLLSAKIKPKHFAFHKSYLQQVLLRSLREYHSGKTIDGEINEHLENVQILYNKGLFSSCKKIIQKAYEIATLNENFIKLMEVLKWQKLLLQKDHKQSVDKTLSNEVFEQELQVAEQFKNLSSYQNIVTQIFLKLRVNGILRNKDEIKDIEILMQDPLLGNIEYATSNKSKFYFYNIYSGYYSLTGNLEKAYENSNAVLDFLIALPLKNYEMRNNYVTALNNHLNFCVNLGMHEEFNSKLAEFKSVEAETEFLKQKIHSRALSLEIGYLLKYGKFIEASQLIQEIEAGIASDSFEIEYRLVFMMNIFYTYFGNNEFKKSRIWLNKLLHEEEGNVRNDLVAFAHLYNIILHIEMGNLDVLDYVVKTTYKYLYKKNRLYKLEALMLNFIREQYPRKPDDAKMIDALKMLKNEVILLSETQLERSAFTYFDIVSWIESKIIGKPFSEIVRLKNPF